VCSICTFDTCAATAAVFGAPVLPLLARFARPHVVAFTGTLNALAIAVARVWTRWLFATDSHPVRVAQTLAILIAHAAASAIFAARLRFAGCSGPHLAGEGRLLHGIALAFTGGNVALTILDMTTRAVNATESILAFAHAPLTFSMVVAFIGTGRVLAMIPSPRRLAVARAFDANAAARAVVSAFAHVAIWTSVAVVAAHFIAV